MENRKRIKLLMAFWRMEEEPLMAYGELKKAWKLESNEGKN